MGRSTSTTSSAISIEIDARAGTNFDYSRYDLNGDGRTGGAHDVAVRSRRQRAAGVDERDAGIEGVSVTFDETRLTDLQILCYYAYSSLYAGDHDARALALGNSCVPPTVAVISGDRDAGAGWTQQFSAIVLAWRIRP